VQRRRRMDRGGRRPREEEEGSGQPCWRRVRAMETILAMAVTLATTVT